VAAAVTGAGLVINQHLTGTEGVPVRASGGWRGDPVSRRRSCLSLSELLADDGVLRICVIRGVLSGRAEDLR
jgi:hypothetical protein